MVFNSLLVISVANRSADVWQHLARFPDPISSEQLLDLVCCFPIQQIGRLLMCIWTFLCLPPPDSFYSYAYYESDSSSTSLDDDDDYDYVSHSD
ncbi:uncharacterized protein LOC132271412 [Cornus florida]|uniref:uncharacterized protein LOC132271412 n=1 Tax=Cornus florida TaxID=4283 RepID=UPI00289808D3|nr:uncharacterized protein LOC132271412 [Cornus florida]